MESRVLRLSGAAAADRALIEQHKPSPPLVVTTTPHMSPKIGDVI